MSPCPIAAADRRLRDAFHHWNKIERAYFEPYEFRVNLNSFLQEARNVTFILQKNKNSIPRFESWYGGWQERLKADPIMKWAVESRNKITKQGDLENESESLVTFTTDWTSRFKRRFAADPFMPSTALIRQALSEIPRALISEESLLCAERRWVDRAFPGDELLGLTSHIVIVLSDLIRSAHEYLRSTVPGSRCDLCGKLEEMRDDHPMDAVNAQQTRKIWLKAETRREIRYSLTGQTRVADETAELARARYGLDAVPEGTNANSLEVAVERFLETAKKILVVDGYLQAFLFALERGRGLRMFRLEMNDRAEKHIAIRQVAAFLELLNVDWAIYVGEAWIASARPGLRHAIDAADRREAISVVGVANDERFCNRWIEFTRTGTKILLGDDHTDTIPANMLLPILAAIRKREESKTASVQPQGNEKWDQMDSRSNSG